MTMTREPDDEPHTLTLAYLIGFPLAIAGAVLLMARCAGGL